MKRSLYIACTALLALWPLSAAADGPSPSPSLESILAAAPAGYSAPVSGPYAGHITASQFGQSWGSDAAKGTSELNTDGFVDGFGMMVADTANRRVMAEFALAFSGQSGALRFMGADNQLTVNDPAFVHVDTHKGLGSYYYGVHMVSTSNGLVVDGFEFVKGNDMFGVAFYSAKDDVLVLASAQAQKQFDLAPASTISSSDWPENQTPANSGSVFEMNQTVIIAIVALGVLLAGGIFLAMRRREAAAFGAAPQQLQPQMSADGNFWWGGSNWISVNDVAPPWAQRSPDGAFWWDGRGWRPVPGAVQLTPR